MTPEMKDLEPFVGEWTVETTLGDVPARSDFEWELDGRFLLQRSEIDHPEAPNGLTVMGLNADGDGYTQHYFDSRGVARVYEMTFADGLWTLTRAKPDFTPLDFSQRYTGRFSDDGRSIEGRWEISHDHENWETDFELHYRRGS